MKKNGRMALVLALTCALLAGCSGGKTQGNTTTETAQGKADSVQTGKAAGEAGGNTENVETSENSTNTEDTTKTEHTGGGRTFAVVVHSTQSTYWQTLNSGAEAAAKESGDSIYFTAPINGGSDINGQVDVMQNCINQGVDGILLAAADVDALVPITEQAIDKGIPVVVVDCGLNTDKYESSIATNNRAAAEELAKKVAEDIGEEGEVAVMNYAAGMLTGSLREDGFKEAMAAYPNITLLETQYYNNDTQKALEVSQNLLTANPNLKAIYATNEFGIVGACRALMEKKIDTVNVYGFDFSDDVLPLLESGICKGTMVQKPYDMGYKGVETLVKVLAGEAVEKDIDSGCVVATPENYLDEDIYQVLYPMGK